MQHKYFDDLFKSKSTSVKLFNKEVIMHKLTHQHINTKFWIVNTSESSSFKTNWSEIHTFPVSTLVDNFLKGFKTN